MSTSLRLDWERDAEGYDLVRFYPDDIQDIKTDQSRPVETAYGTVYEGVPILKKKARPSTVRLLKASENNWQYLMQYEDQGSPMFLVARGGKRLRYRPLADFPALFMEFAHTSPSPKAILALAGKYGLLKSARVEALSDWVMAVELMRNAVAAWQQGRQTGDVSAVLGHFDHVFEDSRTVRVDLEASDDLSRPVMSFAPGTLFAGLWLQFVQAVSDNLELRQCAVCPTWFAYGRGTGRRKSAQYCSERCRKAAFLERAESKAEAAGR